MPIAEEVLVFLDVKGIKKLNPVDKAITKLGYNLRLGGRDLMRMSGSLKAAGTWMMSFATAVFKASDIFQDAMQDVLYSLEDVLESSGFLDMVVDALEWLAETIENIPFIGLAMGAMFIAGIFVLLAAKTMMIAGFMRLLVGSVLSAKTSGLGLVETFKLLINVMLGYGKEQRDKIARDTQELVLSKQLTKQMTLESSARGGATQAKKKDAGVAKKQKKSLFGAIGGVVKLVAAFAVFGLLMYAIGPLFEALSPIFEALGDAFESVFDALEETGVIEWIAEFIRNNKELVVALLVALAMLPLLVTGIKAFGGVLGSISSRIKGVSKVTEGMTSVQDKSSGGMWKTILAVSALLVALVPVIFALKDFIGVAAASGYTITEVGAIIALLVANLGAILAIIVVVVKVLDGLKSMSWQVFAAFLAMIPVVLSLIGAFGWFLKIASETGFTAGGIAGILVALAGSVSLLMVVIAGATRFLAGLNSVNLQAIAYVVTLAGVMIGLIFAFTHFLEVASRTGFRVDEINTLLAGLTAGVIALVAALVVAVFVLASLSVTAAMAMPVVALLLGIGAAALMVGTGFLLAGIGAKMASDAILQLGGNLASVIATLPVVLALSGAIGILALALSAAGAAGFLGMTGLLTFAAGIFALTAALMAMVVPLGIIRAFGGEGAVMAAITKIPSLGEGGLITAPGLAMVHAEETVLPAATTAALGKGGRGRYIPKEPPLTVTVDVSGVSSIEEIIERAVEASVSQISERMAKKYRRSEY